MAHLALEFARAWAAPAGGCCARPRLPADLEHDRRLNAHRIACPVLASMYRDGMLNPTAEGVINWQELFACLRAVGFCRASAHAQAVGIAAYRNGDTDQMSQRDRGGVNRFLNIFRMSPGETSASAALQLQHGFSTTVRDSRFDGESADSTAMDSTAAANLADRVRESRKTRFDEWYNAVPGVMRRHAASGERRCYLDGLSALLGHAKVHGDKSGRWSPGNVKDCLPKAAALGFTTEMYEAQAVFAFSFFWVAFGETDERGQLYMSETALESMYLDSQFPPSWRAGKRFGFREGFEAVAELGSDTGLLLPEQVKEELVDTCDCSRLHTAAKIAVFLDKRGLDHDLDPPVEPEPASIVDLAFLAVLALAFLRGWAAILLQNHDSMGMAVGVAIAVVPTACAVSALAMRAKRCLPSGRSVASRFGDLPDLDYVPLTRASANV